MTAENYHLKWDSHVSYLNSSVATLYKNEKFADVVLYSSSSSGSSHSNSNGNSQIDNAIPTVGISAHKFILSSCSQFFATLFDNTPIPTSHGVLYVVLPPELSHRAIQILVQYIYTGEATVSNDILNEVLRGGEILKIRGLCRIRETAAANSANSNGTSSCTNPIHYGANGTRPSQHSIIPPPQPPPPTTVIHGTTTTTASDLYANQKCSAKNNGINGGGGGCPAARYGIDQLAHSQTSIHSQIRGLGASVMPKDSPVIVKSPKLPQIGKLPAIRENKQQQQQLHGSGITINKEVAIDPDENCCYQAAIVPSILQQHESLQLSLQPPPAPVVPAPPQSLVAISGGGGGGVGSSLCNDVNCNNCSYNTSASSCSSSEPEKLHRQRQRHLSQSDELPHRLPIKERLERDYVDDRCELTDVQLSYSRLRARNGNDRVSNYIAPDLFDPASHHTQAHLIASDNKSAKKYDTTTVVTPTNSSNSSNSNSNATINSNLHSPPLYPHNFLTIKQEPVDWTKPQSTSAENGDDTIDREPPRPSTPPAAPPPPAHLLSPKQPLDFKIPIANAATIKIEVGAPSLSADEDDQQQQQQLAAVGNNWQRLVCDVCKKSFDEPKLWVQHLETHTTAQGSSTGETTTTSSPSTAIQMTNSNTVASSNEGNGVIEKSCMPKKRRRVSQQENNMMDHVTLLCDLCNTSFDTPAEWVRHMNNQHTEIELAMFNSKKDKEQKGTNTNSAINCSSSGSRNHHHHQHHHHHHHHQQQQQQQSQHNLHQQLHPKHQQNNHKKYSHRATLRRNSLSQSPPLPQSSQQ